MRNVVQPRDQIFVKGYEFWSFAKNMGKRIDEKLSKSLSGNYNLKILDNTICTKVSKRAIQKTAETTGDFFWQYNCL